MTMPFEATEISDKIEDYSVFSMGIPEEYEERNRNVILTITKK